MQYIYTVSEDKLNRPWNGAKRARTSVAGNYGVMTCLWRGIFKHFFDDLIRLKARSSLANRAGDILAMLTSD